MGPSLIRSFRTAPSNSNIPLSIVAGGDSRNNREARKKANRMVAKIRPHFVVFTGDMTANDNDQQWIDWFEDWQLTTGKDGMMVPIIPARGNHERNNETIADLFDAPNENIYYSLGFGGNLFRLYTLNTLIPTGGNQKDWLNKELQQYEDYKWKMVQYHQAMRPHTAAKPEQDDLYSNWANLFQLYEVDLVIESDAHVVKQTYPIIPSQESGSEQGFIRNDYLGTVYIGEGGWGSPLRNDNDDKSWTQASSSLHQFKWLIATNDKMQMMTVATATVDQVADPVGPGPVLQIPSGMGLWGGTSTDGQVTIFADSVVYAKEIFANGNSFSFTASFQSSFGGNFRVLLTDLSTNEVLYNTTYTSIKNDETLEFVDVLVGKSGPFVLEVRDFASDEVVRLYRVVKR